MNIRMENWIWSYIKRDEDNESERKTEMRKRARYARFLKWARRILFVEAAVIGFEGLYQLGSLVRGYPSIGGESMVIVALFAFAAYKFREIAK